MRAELRGRNPDGTGPRKFTEPVALSSTRHIDLPLARSACVTGFDLVALRARCTANLRGREERGQAARETRSSQIAPVSVSRPDAGRSAATDYDAAVRGGRTYVLAAALSRRRGRAHARRSGGPGRGFPDWQALVLGVVQGATELLPISSSGHLVLVPWLGDWTYLEEHDAFNQTFDVALHLGTMLAVVGYFFHDLVGDGAGLVPHAAARAGSRRPTSGSRGSSSSRRSPPASSASRSRTRSRRTSASRGRSRSCSPCSPLVLWLADRRPATRAAHELSLKEASRWALRRPRARAGRLALGDHDHGRPAVPARPRRSRAPVVPPARPDGARGGAAEGRQGRRCSATCRPGWKGPFVVGVLSALGNGPARDPVAARLRPPPHLLTLRRLPPGRRRDHRAADRRGARVGDASEGRGRCRARRRGGLDRPDRRRRSLAAVRVSVGDVELACPREGGGVARSSRSTAGPGSTARTVPGTVLSWVAGGFSRPTIVERALGRRRLVPVDRSRDGETSRQLDRRLELRPDRLRLEPGASWRSATWRATGSPRPTCSWARSPGQRAHECSDTAGRLRACSPQSHTRASCSRSGRASDLNRSAGALFHATLAAALIILPVGWLRGSSSCGPESFAWLVTLALTSQVLGWLLIAAALPRAPAALGSVVLTSSRSQPFYSPWSSWTKTRLSSS